MKPKRPPPFVLVIVLILFLAAIAALRAKEPNTPTYTQATISPTATVEQRLALLEAKVASLEMENARLSRAITNLSAPNLIRPNPDWLPREVNGDTYYAIPIQKDEQ